MDNAYGEFRRQREDFFSNSIFPSCVEYDIFLLSMLAIFQDYTHKGAWP